MSPVPPADFPDHDVADGQSPHGDVAGNCPWMLTLGFAVFVLLGSTLFLWASRSFGSACACGIFCRCGG